MKSVSTEAASRAKEKYILGRNCCQAVINGTLEALYELKGEEYDPVLGWKIGRGFGDGMTMGLTCGAITGGIIVAGMYLDESMKDIKNFVKDLFTSFELEFGSSTCKKIKDETKCPNYTEWVARYMADILERLWS
ncbi:MAG: C-GCAxxG-C-C family protein [Candidatus Odinarchaeota archaeon]